MNHVGSETHLDGVRSTAVDELRVGSEVWLIVDAVAHTASFGKIVARNGSTYDVQTRHGVLTVGRSRLEEVGR